MTKVGQVPDNRERWRQGQTGGGTIQLAQLHSTVAMEKRRSSVVRSSVCKEKLDLLDFYDNFSDFSM